ncbi:uncharacterized protein LOC116921508 isoform X1 [Daphnia magna]|uniref:uncharacterized protein LOC116921508 isoform X1 n=2 Tax=Daphnia magna TaxID=35525 RepID=UPI001E1BBB42|nr:uncharacterized protein LOC116921508 isoform X1 [Daphnia magna]
MDAGSPLHVSIFKQPKPGSRKRPFSVANSSILTEYSAENSEDYNILSSLGMKDRDIFQSTESTNLLLKHDSEAIENVKVSTGSIAGHSPYFSVNTTPKKTVAQDIQGDKPTDKDFEPKTPSNHLTISNEQLPPIQLPSEPFIKSDIEERNKPRKLRPVGEFTVTSLDKEYQEIMDFLKQEREQDQLLFLKCSEALRNKTESIIENLESTIKARYQTIDENLRSVIHEFEKEWETCRKLEEEFSTLRNQISSIMNNILQDPGLE